MSLSKAFIFVYVQEAGNLCSYPYTLPTQERWLYNEIISVYICTYANVNDLHPGHQTLWKDLCLSARW